MVCSPAGIPLIALWQECAGLETHLISHKVFETANARHDGNGAVSRCRLRHEPTGLKAAGDDHIIRRHHQQVRCPLIKFGNACDHHTYWQ